MESLSPQVVAASKLPILNPNEFDLWKMRIEQYFLMTDYSLWEVILNGDSPTPTRFVDGVVQPIAPSTAEQRLAKKNELKARGTLLMALPDKHQLKFNIHKDAKSLIKPIEKRFGGNKETKKVQQTLHKQQYESFSGSSSESLDQIHDWLHKIISQLEILDLEEQSLDDLFNNLKIYEAKVKSSSYISHTTQNITFVSSQNTDNTNKLVSAVPSVTTASTKVPVFALPNADNLSDARTGRNLGANGTTSIGFDMSKVECYNCHRRGHFTRECSVTMLVAMIGAFRLMKNQQIMPSWHLPHQAHQVLIMRKSQFDVLSYKSGLKSVEARLVVYQQNENVFEEDIELLKLNVMLRDNALVEIRKKFEATEKERDDDELTSSESDVSVPTSLVHDSETVLNVINVEPSTTKPNKEMSQSIRPSAHIIEDWVSDSEDESEGEPMPTQKAPSFVQPSKHVKTPRTFVKPDCDYYEKKMVQKHVWNHAMRVNHQNSARMTHSHSKNYVVPTSVLTRSRLVPLNAARPVTTVVPQTNAKHHRPAKHVVNKPHSPIRRPINHRPGNPQQALKDKVGGNPRGGKITSKGKIKTGKLDFNDVYFVKEIKFNLFSVSQMCDKKNNVLFIDNECVVLSSNFKLPDENHVLLRVPRENNMYNVDLKNIARPLNFKAMNKLVKGNLVRGLPSKVFENNRTCVPCKKGKQHRASCKTKLVSSVSQPLQRLHMTIFCGMKGIKREFSVVRTPQQNGVAERKNRTLIEAARNMLADSLLPIPFWAEAVNTPCYVQNRVLVTKPHNKTPYELLLGNQPNSSAGILGNFDASKVEKESVSTQQYVLLSLWSTGSKDPQNLDADAAFDDKENENLSDEFEEFSINNTNRVNAASAPVTVVGPNSTNITNNFNADGPSDNAVSPTFKIGEKSSFVDPSQYLDDPNMTALEDIVYSDDEEDDVQGNPQQALKDKGLCGIKRIKREFSVARTPQQNRVAERKNRTLIEAARTMLADSLLPIPFRLRQLILPAMFKIWKVDEGFLVGYSVSSKAFRVFNSRTIIIQEILHTNFLENQPNVAGSGPTWLFDIDTLTQSMNYEPVVTGNQPNSSACIQGNFNADANAAFDDKENESEVHVSPSNSNKPKKHDEKATREAKGKSPIDFAPVTAVGPNSTNITNSFNDAGPSKNVVSPTFEIGGKSLFVDPSQYPDDPNMPALEDIVYSDDEEDVGAEANFSNLETSITISYIPTTIVHKDHPVTQIINDLSLAPLTRKEGIDYEEVFAPIVRIEAIWLFLAYASFMGFMVYQMDVKNAFLYGTIKEEVYACEPPRFKDPDYPDKVYEDDIIFGSTNKELCKAFEKLTKDKFQMSLMGELTFFLGLQVKQKDNRIFISQDKYVAEILRKFGPMDGESASTPINTEKPLLKDPDGEDVDVHIYRHFLNAVSSKLMMFGLTIDDAHLMLLDRKKVIITEDTIRQALRLDDADGIDCLPYEEIFAELARMGYEKPMVRNVDSPSKFLMYPRFLQIMINAQVDDLSSHNTKYTSPTLTQKVFAKMKRIGKGFSRVDTPLFDGMLVQQQVQAVEDAVEDEDDDNKEDASKQGRKIAELDADEDVTLVDAEEDMNADVHGRLAESQAKVYHLDLQHAEKVLSMQDTDKAEPAEVEEVIEVVTNAKLMTEDEAFARQLEAELNKNINWNDVMEQVTRREKQDNTVMKYQALKRKPMTEAQTRKNMMIYLKNMAGFKMDFFKGMTYNDIRPIFEKHYNSIRAFLEKGEKEIEDEGSKRKCDSLNQDAAKKQRINEEEGELKTYRQIIVNDDDDVFIEATPLASKVLLLTIKSIIKTTNLTTRSSEQMELTSYS
uniref:Uncharacterized protein n=1 Tax=Tanacetum cinerariifolium TaxID=118510 RepID=A0A6L2NZ01_TANCI|nr:hypothetical protein [Tanacetum cinerariifolium]